ncbi:MAG: hypothetical protein COA94_07670 [Rickettsiales bacterium]|nr:MAG: hypothetical protein COA94_07670 [Rickettsiales bacterium]
MITSCGRICIGKKKINVSTVLAGQNVGIMQVEDNIWLVQFMDFDIGYFGMDSCRIEPTTDPFGVKLLSMCSVYTAMSVIR